MDIVPYCGIGVIKKGMRRGTPQECYDKKQIRYYGIEQINMDTIKKVDKNAKTKKRIEAEMFALITILRTKIKRLSEKVNKAQHNYEIRSPGDKEEYKKIVDDGEFELRKLRIQLRNAEKDFNEFKLKS